MEHCRYSVVFKKYQVEDEAAIDLPEQVTTGVLLNLILDEASASSEERLEQHLVKLNISLHLFNKMMLTGIERAFMLRQASSDELATVLRAVSIQQHQILPQSAIIETLASALTMRANHSSQILRPEMFDGSSDSPEGWMNFYEHAAKNNGCLSDEDLVINQRPIISRIRRKWHEWRLS